MKDTKKLVLLGLLVAMQITLSRILKIETPITKVSLSFVAIALIGYIYGPYIGFITGIVGDLIGFVLFPPPGGFHPGFTLSAGLIGLAYGVFLYKKCKFINIFLACLFTSAITLFVNTLWLYLMGTKAYHALIIARIPHTAFLFVVKVVVLSLVFEALKRTKIKI